MVKQSAHFTQQRWSLSWRRVRRKCRSNGDDPEENLGSSTNHELGENTEGIRNDLSIEKKKKREKFFSENILDATLKQRNIQS